MKKHFRMLVFYGCANIIFLAMLVYFAYNKMGDFLIWTSLTCALGSWWLMFYNLRKLIELEIQHRSQNETH